MGLRCCAVAPADSVELGYALSLTPVTLRPLKNYLYRPAEELYDIVDDPDEVNNLAAKPEYEGTLKEMRTRLEKWQLKTADPFLLRDGVSLPVIKAYVFQRVNVSLVS